MGANAKSVVGGVFRGAEAQWIYLPGVDECFSAIVERWRTEECTQRRAIALARCSDVHELIQHAGVEKLTKLNRTHGQKIFKFSENRPYFALCITYHYQRSCYRRRFLLGQQPQHYRIFQAFNG